MPEPGPTLNQGWLWLGGSLLAAVIGANVAWFFRHPRPGAIGRIVTRWIATPFSPWLLQLVRLLYYLGLPLAALVWGQDALVGRLLGLQRLQLPPSLDAGGSSVSTDLVANWLDWTRDVGWTAALGIAAWGLLALGWLAYRRALASGVKPVPESDVTVAGVNSSSWLLAREAAYHEVHWAFYRNAPILLLGAYGGSWMGLALVSLEALLNPAWRNDLAHPRQAPERLMRFGLAVLSALLFPLTENLWLTWAGHWTVSWGVAAWARAIPLPTEQRLDQASA
ncbi:MAG TPA: hypothetical protein ENN99_07965 [Chloroflexi bacterium]|nr:hypothetical protein [Chloroflexota bacterium]